MRPGRALVLLLLAGSCRLYAPAIADCALRCGAGGECPIDLRCLEGFCRPEGALGGCECTPGELGACPAPVGCRAEPRTCGPDGLWGPCAGPVTAPEVCNGLDDDCDGVVDEVPGPARCPLTRGVCTDTFEGCSAGQPVACTEASYGPDYERLEGTCDGLDNDCDGVTDARPEQGLGPATRVRLLTGAMGLVTVVDRGDGGLELERRGAALEPLGTPVPLAGALEAVALVEDDVVVARPVDGGVALERGGGSTYLTLSAGPVTTLHLAGASLAVVAGDTVLLAQWLDDGGVSAPRALGPADGGALALSPSGAHLAWPGGVTRVADGALLVDGGMALVALAQRADGGLIGVRVTGAGVERVDDLGGRPAATLLRGPSAGAAPGVSLGLRDDEPVVALAVGGATTLVGVDWRRDGPSGSSGLVVAPVSQGLLRLARVSGGAARLEAACVP